MLICASVPVQRAVAAVLERDPTYPMQWIGELRSRRDVLVDTLRRIPAVAPVRIWAAF